MNQEWIQVSGSWQNSQNWPYDLPPASYDDVFVGDVLDPITVTSTASVTINSIGVAENSTLVIANRSVFIATWGTNVNENDQIVYGTGNWGTIDVTSGSRFMVNYLFENFGDVILGQAGDSQAGAFDFEGNTTLSGGGVVELGVPSTGGVSCGAILGASLVNANNTIEGAGAITLVSFDNQAGGVVDALQSSVAGANGWLSISADTFSNEGVMNVEANATMLLGLDGQTESLSNTGDIDVGYNGKIGQAGARLAVAGDFTLTGSGGLQFKGAGAELTSDGAGNTTFVNESQILAFSSGQIGDAGLLGVNDLSIQNEGLIEALESGVTLTLNTGSKLIDNIGGYIVADNGATVRIDSEVMTGVGAESTGGVLEAVDGGQLLLSSAIFSASNNQDYVGAGELMVGDGSSATILAGGSVEIPVEIFGASGSVAGGVVTLDKGASISGPVEFEGAGATLIDNGSGVGVLGNQGSVYLYYASADVTGSGDTIWFETSGESAGIAKTSGVWDTVHGNDGFVAVINSQTWVYGNSNAIEFEGGTPAGSSNSVGIWNTGSTFDTVTGSNGTVALYYSNADLYSNYSDVILSGSNDQLDSFGIAETFQFSSSGNSVEFGTTSLDNSVAVGFGPGDTFDIGNVFSSYQAMMSDTLQIGPNTLIIDPKDGTTLTLVNVNMASLTPSEFKF